MSATLKAQYQARINAATTATKPLLLAILRVIGEKLGCDMTNLNTVAPQVADTAAAGTSLIDLSYIAKALPSAAGGNAATVTLPFAVEAGDVVYVDDYGAAFRNRPHDYQLSVLPANTYRNSRLTVPVDGNAGINSDINGNSASFSFKLSDGNLLIATPSSAGFYIRVLTPKMDAVLSILTMPAISPGDYVMGSYTRFVGCVLVSANTYRVYYLAPNLGDNSSSDPNRLVSRTFTYTPASRQLGGMTQVATLFSTSGPMVMRNTSPEAFALFDYWVGSSYKLVGLHLQTGAVIDYAAYAAPSSIAYAQVFTPSDGIPRWLILAGTTTYIYRADSNTQISAPANLSAPMLYTQRLYLGGGLFLLSSTAARNVRLVQFSADASSCDIYTIGSDVASALLSVKAFYYLKRGATYTVFDLAGITVLAFTYSAGSAPVTLTAPSLAVQIPWLQGQRVAPEVEIVQVFIANINSTYFDLLFKSSAACLAHTAVSALGVCKAAAAANEPVTITLSPLAVPSSDPLISGVPSGFGYRVLGVPDHQPVFEKSSGGTSGTAFDSQGGAAAAVMLAAGSMQATPYVNVGSAAVLFDSGGRISIDAQRSSSVELFVVTPRLKFRQFASSSGTAAVAMLVETNEPFIAYCYGSMQIVNGGSIR